MNRIKSTLTSLMRSSPLRGEDGRVAPRSVMVLVAILVGLVGLSAAAQRKARASKPKPVTNHHSTTIALTSDEMRLVVVNREANSVSIIQVKDASNNNVATQQTE